MNALSILRIKYYELSTMDYGSKQEILRENTTRPTKKSTGTFKEQIYYRYITCTLNKVILQIL